MNYSPLDVEDIHSGLQDIGKLMLMLDGQVEDVKAIITKLSDKYGIPKRTVRQLASEFVLKRDFTSEPTPEALQKRLSELFGDERL